MAVRVATQADRQQIVDIWNQNRPLVQAYWPEGPAKVPAWTLADAQALMRPRIHFGVSVTGATVNAFLCIHTGVGPGDFDYLVALMIRIDDATGTPAQQRAFLRTRLRTEGKALLLAWAQNAQARNVDFCEGMYPAGGNASMIEMLGNMTTANGIAADTTRPGWLLYRPTPTQLVTALGGVT